MRSREGPSKRNSLVSTHRQAELPGQGWGGRACLRRLLGFPSAFPVPLPITSAGSHALAQGLRCHCSTVIRAQASASLAPLLDQEKEREEDYGEGQLQGRRRKESNAADECSLRGGNHSLGRDGDIPKVERWKTRHSHCNYGNSSDYYPSLGWENPLERDTATHSSILAWRTPWTV